MNKWLWGSEDKVAAESCSMKKLCLKILGKTHMKTLLSESLFNRVGSCKPAVLIKRGSDWDVFLWILRVFSEHLFYRTSPRYYFLTSIDDIFHHSFLQI